MAHSKIHDLRVKRRGTKGKRRDQLTKQIQALRPKPEPPITQSLGPKDIRREIQTATDLRYGDTERTLGAQRRASERFTRQIPEYFSDYQKQIAALRGQADASAKAEQEALTKRTEQTSIAEEAARKALSQQEAANAARVQGVVPSPVPDQQAQAAASSRRTAQDTFQSLLGAQRQAQQGFETARSIGGMREEARRLEGEGRYRRGIEQKQIDLAKDKGLFKTEHRANLRESERKWLLDQAAASAAGAEIEQKADAARLLNKRYRAGRRQKGRESRKTIAFQNEQNKELLKLKQQIRDSYKPPGGGKGKEKDSYGSDDHGAAGIKLRGAMADDGVKRLIGTSVKAGRALRREYITLLVNKYNFSKSAAYRAVERQFAKDMKAKGWGKYK